MSDGILLSTHPKKPFNNKNGSGELDVFEAASYFSGVTENFSGNHRNMRPIRRMSLDMQNHKENSIPLKSMLIETPTMITKEKKFKQPSSPGGKLAHFLNSLFNQTSLKKSKSKKKSTNDEGESPSGWRRKRRSSISHFRSGNSTSTATDTAAAAATTAISAGFRTPPPSMYTTSYLDPRSYSCLKSPPTQITKIPITENFNKKNNFDIKNDLPVKNMSLQNGFVKGQNFEEKQEEDHYKYVPREDIRECKKFVNDDDGADSDSSSDLFELTNCDLGHYSSGLPVYETTRMDSIKRGVPIVGTL